MGPAARDVRELGRRQGYRGPRPSWRLPERLEERLVLSTFFTVNSTSSDATVVGSLPYEVAQANASSDEAIVKFDPVAFATHQTITLTSTLTLDHASEPKVPISIVGPAAGVTIAGGGSGSDFSVITVTSDTQQAAIKGDSPSASITITAGNLTGAAESGAGIDDLGVLTLENVAITNNTSAGGGGGIELSGGPSILTANPGAALLASDTTFSGNTAAGAGGGVDMEGSAALIVNSTFSGNTAGTTGGAINNGTMLPFVSLATPVNLGVINDTISGNMATNDGGGIDNHNGGVMGILNAIVAGNTVAAGGTNPDVDSGGTNAVYTGSSHVLIGDPNGLANSGISDGTNHDIVGHPALLASLGDYGGANDAGALVTGGANQTVALLPGSPAINDALVLASVTANVGTGDLTIKAGTQLPVPALHGSTFPYEQGKVILVGSEQMLVTGVSSNAMGGGYTLTVTRGVHGTMAATHNAGDPIFVPDERGAFSSSNSLGSFQTQGFKVTVQSGNSPQSTAVSTAFGNPLGVTVTANDPQAPVDGGVITYTAPTSGASATLASNTATITGGVASVDATANGSAGSYAISASAGFGTAATFSLTNTVSSATISATAASIASTEGATFSGGVATFTDSDAAENVSSDFTATIDWGDGATTAGTITTAAGGGFGVTGSHQYADEGTKSVVVTVADNNGATGTVTATATVVDAVFAASTLNMIEGTSATIQLATLSDPGSPDLATDFSVTIDWGDGTPVDTTGQVAGGSGNFAVVGTHTYRDEGTKPVVVTIAESNGIGVVGSVTATATVGDAALTAGTATTVSAAEGATFSGTVAAFTDANSLATAGDFTATITWGDGATTTGAVNAVGGAFQVTGTHIFSDENAGLPMSIVVSDIGGSVATLSGLSVVADAPLTPTGVTFGAVAGQTFSGQVATFTDANSGATATDFTASIDWGDGATSTVAVTAVAGGGFAVTGSHLYAQATTHSVKVVIDDVGGAKATVTSTAVFADVVVASQPVSIAPTEGTSFSGKVATFTGSDPNGTAADFSAAIVWGDGATTVGTVSGSAAGGYTVSGSHAYAEETASAALAIVVTDKLGDLTNIANPTKVADAKLHISAVTVTIPTGGVASNVLLATFTDDGGPEPSANYHAAIDWGDGTTTSGTVASSSGVFQITGSHTYGRAGSFNVGVAIQDDGGSVDALVEQTSVQFTTHQDHQEYVAATYEDVLGRAPDPGGLAYWAQQLDAGALISSIAAAIGQSAEYYGNFVIKPDYLELLGRAADATGLQYWTTQMLHGVTDQQLEAGFIASDEFFQNAGGTNLDWVDAAYKLLLGRSADTAGAAYWNNQLTSLEKTESAELARVQVALGISNSQENNTNLIDADYFHYLGRAADPGGLTYWLTQFAAGATNEDVIAGFTGSAEYYKDKTGVSP
ncbi:MAG TPA: DUF4214 domain-containing protein [Pirellulales bacterium]|nr:DUF4214 domain-containing protein [Pirellulales bacterium]